MPYKPYLISYRYEDAEWNAQIHALDRADAERRVRAMAYARVDGELLATIPAHSGWLAPLIVWLRNRFWR